LQEQREELEDIVGYKIHLDAFADAGRFDCLLFRQQPQNLSDGQHVDAAKVVVRIRGWKAVQVRAADCREKQRIRMSCRFIAEQVEVDHLPYSGEAAVRRARIKNSLARS